MLSAKLSLCQLVCILYCVPKLTPENGKKYAYVNEIYPFNSYHKGRNQLTVSQD